MSEHDPFAPGSAVKPPADDVTPTDATEETTSVAERGADAQTPPAGGGAEKTGSGAPDDASKVPVGTSKEVLDWVGQDKAKAQAALDAEKASGEPRKGLTRELEELLG